MPDPISQIMQLLESCNADQRRIVFENLRQEFPIHPVEAELNTEAEIILEAIARDQSGLTFRMMRGVIAEAAFELEVVQHLEGWRDQTPLGDLPYDFHLADAVGTVRVQVKLQRSKDFRPMHANEAYRRFGKELYVVETQKTRSGTDPSTGESTRSYHFGQFDILAVALHPSTNDWSKYLYTVERWLLPDVRDSKKILKFQPLPQLPNKDWTDNFEECVEWFRSDIRKTIQITA